VPLRTIVEEKLVEARINQALEFYPRLREVWDALIWRLARDPRCGQRQGTQGDWYALKTVPWKVANVPSIMLIYQLKGDTVVLQSSRIELPDDDEELG
jgi:hypothetical protein